MIAEDYVSFETAKLLKEKGFNEICEMFYCKPHEGYMRNRKRNEWWNSDLREDMTCTCPTLQMAMKWLREVHDLHIIAYPWKADREEKATHWCCKVYKSFNLLGYEKYTDETPKSYEEACKVAIRYCLENLI